MKTSLEVKFDAHDQRTLSEEVQRFEIEYEKYFPNAHILHTHIDVEKKLRFNVFKSR